MKQDSLGAGFSQYPIFNLGPGTPSSTCLLSESAFFQVEKAENGREAGTAVHVTPISHQHPKFTLISKPIGFLDFVCTIYTQTIDSPHIRVYVIHMKSQSIIKMIESDGWYFVRATGDHHHYKHPTKPGLVTVPHPQKDVPIGTLKSIERQAGIKLR